jgi:ribonucleoside-triphosphate reductase
MPKSTKKSPRQSSGQAKKKPVRKTSHDGASEKALEVDIKIEKRSGRLVDFKPEKIERALHKALTASDQGDGVESKKLTKKVVSLIKKRFKREESIKVEEIQDIVEEVLILEDYIETAKSYILYREQHRRIRDAKTTIDESLDMVDKYIKDADWQVRENSNMGYSLQGLHRYLLAAVSKKYWLNKIYPKEIRDGINNNAMHIHDLDFLGPYCCGWDLHDLLVRGFGGVKGKVESAPAKHLRTALGQLVNFFYTLQGESAGAQACWISNTFP